MKWRLEIKNPQHFPGFKPDNCSVICLIDSLLRCPLPDGAAGECKRRSDAVDPAAFAKQQPLFSDPVKPEFF